VPDTEYTARHGRYVAKLFQGETVRAFVPPPLPPVPPIVEREITFLDSELPAWMDEVLEQTPYSPVKLREFFEQGKPLPPVADNLS